MTARKGGRPIGTTAAGSLAEARRRKEWALARLRETELERRRGQLHEDAACLREWQSILRTVRNAVLAVPSRLRERLPLTASELAVIDAEIRLALAALGEGRPYPDTVAVEASP